MLFLFIRRYHHSRNHININHSIAKLISTVHLTRPHHLPLLRHLITPSISHLSLLRLLFNHHHHSAFSLLTQLSQLTNTSNHSSIDLDSFLCTAIESGHVDFSLHLVSTFKPLIRCYTFNELLKRLLLENRLQEVVFWLKEGLKLRFFPPDTCSFNIGINACFLAGDFDGAFRFLAEMGKFGCVADGVTCNLIVDGLCKGGRVNQAWEFIRGGKLVSDVKTYTSAMAGFCKSGRMVEARKVFDEMVRVGIVPSRVSYNVLVDGYGKVGDLDEAGLVYERMQVSGCSPDVFTFTSLINGYCRKGLLDDAMKIWNDMREKGVKPNGYTFSIFINALCKKNRLNEARELLKELNRRKDVVVSAFVYNPVIDGFSKAGKVEEASLIMGEMVERGCKPDKHTYTILIIGFCMKAKMIEAIELFNRMVDHGCVPDHVVVSKIVSLLLRASMPSEAKRVLEIASGLGIELDVSPSI